MQDLLLLHLNIKAVIYQYMNGVLRGYSVFSGVLKQKVTFKPQKKNEKLKRSTECSTKRTENSAEGFSGQTIYFLFPIGVVDTWMKCQ